MEHDIYRQGHIIVIDAADADGARVDHLDEAGAGLNGLDVFVFPAAAEFHEVDVLLRLAAVDEVGVGVARVGYGGAEEGGIVAWIAAVRRDNDRNVIVGRVVFLVRNVIVGRVVFLVRNVTVGRVVFLGGNVFVDGNVFVGGNVLVDGNVCLGRNALVVCWGDSVFSRRWLGALSVGVRAVQVVAGNLLRVVAQEDVLTGVAGVQADLAG